MLGHLDVVVGDLELTNSALVNCFLVALSRVKYFDNI